MQAPPCNVTYVLPLYVTWYMAGVGGWLIDCRNRGSDSRGQRTGSGLESSGSTKGFRARRPMLRSTTGGVSASCVRPSSYLRSSCRPPEKRILRRNGRFNPRSNPMALVCNMNYYERLRQYVGYLLSAAKGAPSVRFLPLRAKQSPPYRRSHRGMKGGGTDVGGAGSGEREGDSRKTLRRSPLCWVRSSRDGRGGDIVR